MMHPYDFWQQIHPSGHFPSEPPYRELYPASLPDGRQLALPIRSLPDGTGGLASLIVNQASFAVLDALAATLAQRLQPHRVEMIVGLPTLGLTLAAAVAQRLGHERYVPLGTSRKFWYREELSVPMSSITTPDARRLYLDPRLLPLIEGRRVALIDDVISTGTSITAGLGLLAVASVTPVAIGCAMLQSDRWRHRECETLPDWQARTVGAIETPLLASTTDGWIPAQAIP
jgi:adenine/guanine phosphoribosyltransferase-like PRPP-binding protein